MRTSTFVMIGFAVLFGLLAVFLAQIWLNNQADERLKSIDAQRKAAPPARSIVVAGKPLRFGDELTSASLREMPWPDNALPAGAFGKIADLTVEQARRADADRHQRSGARRRRSPAPASAPRCRRCSAKA